MGKKGKSEANICGANRENRGLGGDQLNAYENRPKELAVPKAEKKKSHQTKKWGDVYSG